MAFKKKVPTAVAVKDEQVIKAVSGLSLDSASSKLAQTSVEVQKALANIGVKLTEQLSTVSDVEKAIDLKREELKQLHGIEVAANTLEELTQKMAEVDQNIKGSLAAFEQELADKQAESEKERVRAEDEYCYKTGLRRRTEEDAHKDKLAKAAREYDERLLANQKVMQAREDVVKAAEKELAEHRVAVARFPDDLKKGIDKAEAILSNVLKKHYETEARLAAKDAEGAAKLAEQRIISLEGAYESLTCENSHLRDELKAVRQDSKDVQLEALKSASGRDSLVTLQRSLSEKESASPTSKPGR